MLGHRRGGGDELVPPLCVRILDHLVAAVERRAVGPHDGLHRVLPGLLGGRRRHLEPDGHRLVLAREEPVVREPPDAEPRATASVPVNYQVFAHLTRPDTVLWGQSDKLNPGDFPTTRWPLDKFIWDDHSLRVLPGTPPGDYRLSIGLYTLENGQRAPILDDRGQIIGDNVVLDQVIHVLRPGVPTAIDSLQIQKPLNQNFDGSTVLGWSLESSKITLPNFARLTLLWRADADRLPNLRDRAELVDSNGRVVQTIDNYPVQNAYPMTQWQRGEIVRDQIAFWLPPDFMPGQYIVWFSVGDEQGNGLKLIDQTLIEVTK